MSPTEIATNQSNAQEDILELRKDLEVQAAMQAGANSTQAATHAGTWSAVIAGAGGLVVGMFLALAMTAVARSS